MAARAVVLLLALVQAGCVSIRSKGLPGSVCLHEEQDGLPFHFDRGELAEHLLLSNAVHVTRHGVRFISRWETVLAPLNAAWHSVPCVLRSDRHGALCVVMAGDSGRVASYVLPCSDTYTPLISEGNHTGVAAFMLGQVPEELRGCRGGLPGDDAGARGTDASGFGAYDVTQCDLLHSEVTLLYSTEHQVLYLRQGAELSGWLYVLAGVLVVLLVSLIARDLLDLCLHPAPAAAVSWKDAAPVLLLAATSMAVVCLGHDVFVTTEDLACFWILVAYIGLRICMLVAALAWRQEQQQHGDSRTFNLLISILLLLVMRVYMTVSTPYTPALAVLLGTRLVCKLLVLSDAASAGTAECILQVADAFSVQAVCWAGIGVNFDHETLVRISHTVLLFASAMLGGMLYRRTRPPPTFLVDGECMWKFDLAHEFKVF